MGHLHNVYDDDAFFVINATTRKITNSNSEKKLIQGDHNSERFTFEIPRFIEGHDLSLCNKVEVHYINVSANRTEQSADVYLVDDMQIGEGSANVVIFSWLISANATKYAGTLNFLIRFVCLDGETIEYAWNTAIFDGITVADGMDNGEAVIAEYSDVLEAWKQEVLHGTNGVVTEIEAAHDAAMNDIAEAKAKMLSEIELAAEIVQTTGESETAVMSQKVVSKLIGRSLSLDSDDAYVIADGTDFDTLTVPRTYKVRTWSSGCTMKNSPNKNSGRLIVMNTSDHDKVLQVYVANTTDALVYIRIKDGGWKEWASVVTSDVTDKLRSDIDLDRTFPVKLRVMQYNIGKFNMGFGHDNPKIDIEEVVAKIANYKRFFGEYQPNILGVQEFTDYIDCTDNKHETNATLFDDVFPYSTTQYYGNILKSDIVPYVAEDIILDEGNEHSQPAKKAEYLINGKVLGVIVGAGDWRDECVAHRKAEIKNAMARLSECDHAIICLDWNVKSQEEFDDLVSEAETAGYVVANGGYFGSYETYGKDNCYRCIDQILCKGAKIKNVVKPDVYTDLASDHYPLIADIILI